MFHYSDWYTQADGNWTTTWLGYVDLTTPGTYTLTALLTNEVPDPYDCFPLDDPSTPENEWVPGWGDDGPICLEYTIKVRTCCACEDEGCEGELSGWTNFAEVVDVPSCGPADHWPIEPDEEYAYYDSCGNKLEIICDGMYHYMYNGTEVGDCIWLCGQNTFLFKLMTTPCGSVFAETLHRTIDAPSLAAQVNCAVPPANDWYSCDCGINGLEPNFQIDWKDTLHYLNQCIYGPDSWERCCTSGANVNPDPGHSVDPDYCPTQQHSDNCRGCVCP